MNSPTKDTSPGSASDDNAANMKNPASTGAALFTPPKSEIRLDPLARCIKNPAVKNSAAVDKPCAIMYTTEPLWPIVVNTKIPSAINPKCDIEE